MTDQTPEKPKHVDRPTKFRDRFIKVRDKYPGPYLLFARRNLLYVRWEVPRAFDRWAKLGEFQTADEVFDFVARNIPDYDLDLILYVRGNKPRGKNPNPRMREIQRLSTPKTRRKTRFQKLKISEAVKGSRWIIDGKGGERRLRKGEPLPEGWRFGRYRWALSLKKLDWEDDIRRTRHGRRDDMKEETLPDPLD